MGNGRDLYFFLELIYMNGKNFSDYFLFAGYFIIRFR